MGVIGHLLNGGFKLFRARYGTNAIGEKVKGYDVVYYHPPAGTFYLGDDFNGRLRPMSGREKQSADKKTQFATHRIYCPIMDIKPTDRIKYKGQMFEVLFASNVMDSDEFMQVDCELIT